MNAPVALKNDVVDVRSQFPGLGEGWHYLDTAATAQKPQAVIDAITKAYAHDYATVHRGVYERSAAMTQSYEAARDAAASLIGGKAAGWLGRWAEVLGGVVLIAIGSFILWQHLSQGI